jgi:pimeloyl-ACP methyl ester carboxylesterase
VTDRLQRCAYRAAMLASVVCLVCAEVVAAGPTKEVGVGRVPSADGVELVYTARGSGSTALVFIHGGLADRTFWAPQLKGLAKRFRVVTLDLAGHGESGRQRHVYTIRAWAQDVRAVVDVLALDRVVLIGNSLGGPVALEAAALLPGRVIGVIGVDTLHDLTQKIDAATAHARAKAFSRDYQGTCREMVNALFHTGKQPELRAWAESRMCAGSKDVAVSMMESFGDYDVARAARAAGAPIRAINGELWPTNVETNRTVVSDFEVRVMKDAGHYPMLERPAEFNRILTDTVLSLEKAATGPHR